MLDRLAAVDAAAVVSDFTGEAPSRLTAAANFLGDGVTPAAPENACHDDKL